MKSFLLTLMLVFVSCASFRSPELGVNFGDHVRAKQFPADTRP